MSRGNAAANGTRAVVATSLAGTEAWVVGGAPRDRLLGRETDDIDVVLTGDVAAAARELGRRVGGTPFALSDEFGAWRVVAHDHSWQVDLNPLRGGSLEDDLRLRDFTINAIAEPLAGGELIDPLGGAADLAARRLRAASPRAFADDPLRVLRLVRFAVELGLEGDAAALDAARREAPGLAGVAGERVFGELRRVLAADAVLDGLRLLDELAATEVILPELTALRGVEQNRFHHRDVFEHTIEVLAAVVELQRDPAALLGVEHAEAVAALLREPLSDELTRGTALRLGALLHDIAKPVTRGSRDDGRVTFIGHDVEGARMSREILTRLRTSERLRVHVAALARRHLRLGFLVHEMPLTRRATFAYLRDCAPVEVDVTLLSVADRLATRGDGAEEAIERHVRLARSVLADAFRWRESGPPAPLLRGDELASELRIAPGPDIGRQLEQLQAAQYAGEVRTRDEARAWARAAAERVD